MVTLAATYDQIHMVPAIVLSHVASTITEWQWPCASAYIQLALSDLLKFA